MLNPVRNAISRRRSRGAYQHQHWCPGCGIEEGDEGSPRDGGGDVG